MTVNSQLHACRDALMAGMRAASRGTSKNARATVVIRACLDLVEVHLMQDPSALFASDLDTTMKVLEQAVNEFDEDPTVPRALITAVTQAAERLHSVRLELANH